MKNSSSLECCPNNDAKWCNIDKLQVTKLDFALEMDGGLGCQIDEEVH